MSGLCFFMAPVLLPLSAGQRPWCLPQGYIPAILLYLP